MKKLVLIFSFLMSISCFANSDCNPQLYSKKICENRAHQKELFDNVHSASQDLANALNQQLNDDATDVQTDRQTICEPVRKLSKAFLELSANFTESLQLAGDDEKIRSSLQQAILRYEVLDENLRNSYRECKI